MRTPGNPRTERSYQADRARGRRLCAENNMTYPPRSSDGVIKIIHVERDRGVAFATIGRLLAALGDDYEEAGIDPSPVSSRAVRSEMRKVKREIGPRRYPTAIPEAKDIRRMLKTCDDSRDGLRARAIITLLFVVLLRRSEIVAINTTDVCKYGPQVEKLLVELVQVCGIVSGPVFRHFPKGGRVSEERLSTHWLNNIVKDRASLVGLSWAAITTQSIRCAGMTAAHDSGVSVLEIQRRARRRTTDAIARCIRRRSPSPPA